MQKYSLRFTMHNPYKMCTMRLKQPKTKIYLALEYNWELNYYNSPHNTTSSKHLEQLWVTFLLLAIYRMLARTQKKLKPFEASTLYAICIKIPTFWLESMHKFVFTYSVHDLLCFYYNFEKLFTVLLMGSSKLWLHFEILRLTIIHFIFIRH